MGDIVATTGKVKDGGRTTTIQCPMLNVTNYTVWSIRMKLALQVHKVWDVIEDDDAIDADKKYMAKALLFQSIPETLILQV